MTAIGPLTTTFRPPSSCTTNAPNIYQIQTGKQHYYVQGPLFESGSEDCFPSGYDASPSAYYSPGFCPQGYTAACTNLLDLGKTGASPTRTVTGSAAAVETALICCPTDFSYTCLGSGTRASMGCTTSYSAAEAVINGRVVSGSSTGSYEAFTETEGGFAAHSIQVRFRASDPTPSPFRGNAISQSSSPEPTAPSTNGAQSTTIATFSVPAGPPPGTGESTTESKAEAGISTGAVIGIAIGSAIAGILAVGILCLFFFLRWRRKRRAPPVPPKEPSVYNRDTLQPFELSEESTQPSQGQSRRPRVASSAARRSRARPSTRGGAIPEAKPAELEAVVPSDASNISSFNDRRSPDSSNSGWTLRQQREGVMPTPWI